MPFLAPSLEDIDSVNFALGVRDFDVAKHRPHPPGYPVYIFLGKIATAIAGFGVDAAPSMVEAKALAVLSLFGGLFAIGALYLVFSCFSDARPSLGVRERLRTLDITAFSATAIAASCPLFWYLAVRPMSDLPGLALALAAQACLMVAWWQQAPGPDGDRRLPPAITAASGRMIVIGAFLAALSIGLRSQTVWLTVPLLMLVLVDRIGRGVAGAMIGGGVMFVAGGLAWGIPLLVASGGLNAYLAALGTQAGEDFAAGEMLYLNPNPRAAAFALMRTFVDPWDSAALATVVLILAAAGVVQLLWRDRRSLSAIGALMVPYLVFHLLFQDTVLHSLRAAAGAASGVPRRARRVDGVDPGGAYRRGAGFDCGCCDRQSGARRVRSGSESNRARGRGDAGRSARLAAGRAGDAPDLRASTRSRRARDRTQLPSPPRLEWLELVKYWKSGRTEPLWLLADPARSDLALIDPASLQDSTQFRWPLVARPAFGGMRPSAVRWYRFLRRVGSRKKAGRSRPETAGIARINGTSPASWTDHRLVRRREGAARLLIGGRNLVGGE